MKVLVGLSGGVDSAVAAYLLQQQGYEVCCCFMRNWDSALNNDTLGNPTLNDDICPQESDYLDAVRTAEKLGLELRRVDYITEYWEHVFRNFVEEYGKGRTPNPDILCNKYIKFDSFLRYAMENGFDMIATGHYFKREDRDGDVRFLKAFDRNKDQSYFLAQVSRDALAKSLFPLGDITKPEVRRIAEDLGIPVADKKDSTGICFIGERNFREFLKNYLPMKEGDIIDLADGKVIGRHQGVYYYTLGQRKGFAVGGENGPYYCAGKDVKKNELYLTSHKDESFLYSDQAEIGGINWIRRPEEGPLQVKFRYRQEDQKVTLKHTGEDRVMLSYPQGIKAVTPGQQAVFYQNDELLGGGVIEETFVCGESSAERLQKRLYG